MLDTFDCYNPQMGSGGWEEAVKYPTVYKAPIHPQKKNYLKIYW